MGHILWWLWLISIHIEHSASESRRVQRRMSAARLPTLYSLIRLERRHNLTPPHGGKVNGRAGTCLPIRFNELCKRSMHSFTSCDCLAAKYAESTRVWHSRFWGILWKKKKNQGLWEESHWLWNKWKIQLHEMSLWKWVIQRRYLCRVWESFQKDLQDRSQVLLIVPSGTLLRSTGWTHMPLFHRHLLGSVSVLVHCNGVVRARWPKGPVMSFVCDTTMEDVKAILHLPGQSVGCSQSFSAWVS